MVQKIEEGWEGKPKGLLQILWERGWIDEAQWKEYTLVNGKKKVNGKKNALGKVDLTTSLRHLMGQCDDFQNEEGMLQFIARQIGVEVILTPKCHAELAGEGIKYMWGYSKKLYRNLPLKKKRGIDKFHASVRHCLSQEMITINLVQKFAKRARRYLIAYHAIDNGHLGEAAQQENLKFGPISVERLIGKFKTYRCAFNFDYKFLKECSNPDDNRRCRQNPGLLK